MKKWFLMAVCACACAGFAAKVTSVTIKSADGNNAGLEDVQARCQVKAGDDYDPAQCARDVRILRDAGEYDHIVVTAEHGATGIDVVYTVTRKKRFHGPLQVIGNDYWSVSKIAEKSELKDGYAYGEADFEAAAGRVRQAYQKKYFSDVKVTYAVEPVAGSDDAVTVTFTIVEGKRKKIHQFAFAGNASVESAELREAIGRFPWWNPIGWFSEDVATDQDFAEARDKIVAYYRDRGYLDVTVSLPEEVVRPDGRIDRRFTVVEGTRYKVGKISVTGVTRYPAEAVLGANKTLVSGDVAGAKAMTDAARAMEVFCGSGEQPLTDTHVRVRQIPSADDPEKLDLEFVVKEGVPVTINRILVRGNDYTKDKVLRREITLSPGDPMLADRAEQSKRRLENLRYFDRVHYYLEKVEGGEAKDGQPERRDLVYEVAEKNTGNFMVGIGASSVDSVYGTIELSESNFDLFNPWRFRGAGQKGRILVQAGPRIQTYEASVTEPYLFDRLLELTVTGYRRQRWYDEYDIIRNGLSTEISYPVKFWPTARTTGRLGFRLAAELIEFDDVENSSWYNPATGDDQWHAFKEEEDKYGDNWEIPFRIFWEDDTRDSFIFAKKGHRTSVYGDLVGGDNQYWRLGFNYRQYLTVWKKYSHVFSFGVRGETVDAFSGDLPIYNRLFLGGPRSIRGVEYREISPRVWQYAGKKGRYAAWGGQTSWCVNMEYTVPIVKYVRFAFISDLGSVGSDEFDFGTDYFCWTAGVGLRLDIEQFPIRLDFATPIVDPDDGVDEELFSFTIGYDF